MTRNTKTIFCFLLRLCIFMPIAFLAYACDGMSDLFKRLSDGFFDMAKATQQITMAPYVSDIQAKIDEEIKIRKTSELKAFVEKLK